MAHTQAKHTPGPRTVEGAKVYATIGDDQKALIGTCYGYDEGEAVANANLYAAAPDLLRSLTKILHLYEFALRSMGQTSDGFETSREVIEARAAIAKAEGN